LPFVFTKLEALPLKQEFESLPHLAFSILQVEEQPSPSYKFPSSHPSFPLFFPSPQTFGVNLIAPLLHTTLPVFLCNTQ
jgi:hypothetical protein